jgi:glycogen operon protein
LADPAVIDHLLRLGITAVELLPVQHFVSETALVASGRRNVWGYNPLAWGAPHNSYASAGGDPVAELRAAVDALHEAGLEVWLDVVFNHTCEGGLGSGPILSWRGFDNADTYRLRPGPHGLVDDDLTGCGNTVDFRSDAIRALVRQLLVRWVEEYGIDGFRFDLAAVALRGDDGPDPHAPLLAELAGDDRLSSVRLVAEPWDVGLGGYALGGFPPPWREWNDRFRDDARALWLGGEPHWSTLATRFTASADVFGGDGSVRPASATVNAVATHDGFTLADLVTWSSPVDGGHGQASDNSGAEGPTADPEVLARRARRQRCLLGWLLAAQGVPMVAAGDEMGRSQGGHADGYVLEPAQWALPWAEADWDLVAWTAEAVRVRASHPVLRRERRIAPGDPAVGWLDEHGEPLDDDRWHDPARGALQVLLGAEDDGEAPVLVVVVTEGDHEVRLPAGRWWVVLDARLDRGVPVDAEVWEGQHLLEGPVVVILEGE